MQYTTSVSKAGLRLVHHHEGSVPGDGFTVVAGYDIPTGKYFGYIEVEREVNWSSLDYDSHGDQRAMLSDLASSPTADRRWYAAMRDLFLAVSREVPKLDNV